MTLITDASKDDKSTRPPIAPGSSDTMEVDSPGRTEGSRHPEDASVQTWASQAGHENSQWPTQTSNNSARYRNPYAETVSDDSASVASLPTTDTLDHEVPATTPTSDNGATPSFLMATPETGAEGTSHSPQPLGASPSTPADGLYKGPTSAHPMFGDQRLDPRLTPDPYTAHFIPPTDVTFKRVVTTGPGAVVGLNGVEVNGRVIFEDVNTSGPNCCVGINPIEAIIAARARVAASSSLAAVTEQPAAPSSIPSHMASSSQSSWPPKGMRFHSRGPDGTEWWRVPQFIGIPPSTVPSGPIIGWKAYDSEAKKPLSSFDQPVPLTWVPIYAAQTSAHDASAMSQTDP